MSIRTCLAAAVAAAVASAASADTVRLQFTGTGSGRNVRVNLAGNAFNTFAGQLEHTFSLGTGVAAGLTGSHVTFCTDLTQYVSSGGATYSVVPIANLPQSSGWPAMGATRAQGIYNLYAAAAGAQSANGANSDLAAAFQIAVWEIAYDYNGTASSLDMGAGNVRVTQTNGAALTSAVTADLTMLFAAVTGPNVPQAGLLGLANSSAQDQIVEVPVLVPLPHAAWAGLAGLAIAAGIKRRYARR